MLYCLQSLHSMQVNVGEVCRSYRGAAKVGIVELGIGEDSIAEVSIAEVGIVEIGLYLRMLLSPHIPNICSLLEHAKVLQVCQLVHLLCSALIIEGCRHDCKYFSFCFSSGDGSPLVLLT